MFECMNSIAEINFLEKLHDTHFHLPFQFFLEITKRIRKNLFITFDILQCLTSGLFSLIKEKLKRK